MEDDTTTKSGQNDHQEPVISNDNAKRRSNHATPPYWQRHRSVSSLTQQSLDRPLAIRLEDNTEPDSKTHQKVWARSVSVNEYSVVQGNMTGIGAYVVWTCVVQTLDGGPMTIRKRYSEFNNLRAKLVKAFPQSSKKSLPPLPPKSAIYKFKAKFLEQRQAGLAYFLTCVLLNPEYASSPIVKEFIFLDTTDS